MAFHGRPRQPRHGTSVRYAKFSQETENGTCQFLPFEEKNYGKFHIFNISQHIYKQFDI